MPSNDFVYVRTSGDDNNSGDSPDTALRTIQAGVDKATRGEQVVVGPGRYTIASGDSVVDIESRSGSAGEPIQIVGDINGARTGDAPGAVLVDAAGRLFGFRVINSSGVILDGLMITGAAGDSAAGIQIRTDSREITIKNCEIVSNGGDGIRTQASSDLLLFNNLIHSNAARGIQLGSATVDTRIINNTVANNVNDGISASGDNSRDIFLRNNIVSQNMTRGIDIRDSALDGYNADYNLVFHRAGISVAYGPETPPGANDVNLEPLFANGFFLWQTPEQRSNSPALDAGDPLTDLQLADSLHARTTKTNLDTDMGIVDIGYHYLGRFVPPPTRTLPVGTTPPGQVTPTPPASSVVLYVRASGNDSADGRSPSTALATIQAAVDRATLGNEIVVGPGTYVGNVAFRAPGADPERPIVLRANPRGDRTGDAPGDVLLDGNQLGSALLIDAAPYIIVDGFRITNSALPGVQIRRGSHGAQLRNCEVFQNEDGVRIQDSDDVVVFNTLIYCNTRRGIVVTGPVGSNNNQLINNTIAQNGDRGVFIGNSEAASKNTFMRNNIIQNNRVSELQVVTQTADSLEGYDSDYNMVFDEAAGDGQYNGATPGANDIIEPAGFVSVASCVPLELHDDDYRLSPSSPGVDTGDPETDPGFTALLQQKTTASSNALDAAPVDMGFHFLP